MLVDQILDAKGRAVATVAPDATVADAVASMAEHNVGALVVSSDGHAVEGIVSERDVVRRLHDDEALLDAPVSTIMTTTVHTCPPEADLDAVMTEMTERRIRHVPVVGDDGLCGLVSIGDVVKHKISALQFERDQLDSYVHQT